MPPRRPDRTGHLVDLRVAQRRHRAVTGGEVVGQSARVPAGECARDHRVGELRIAQRLAVHRIGAGLVARAAAPFRPGRPPLRGPARIDYRRRIAETRRRRPPARRDPSVPASSSSSGNSGGLAPGSNVPRCPPASGPCTTSRVRTGLDRHPRFVGGCHRHHVSTPRSRSRASTSGAGHPKVNEATSGATSATTSSLACQRVVVGPRFSGSTP